ncbi:hypothetical protein ACQPYK_27245 [Streptosporangium sp. CA-135522]|uniref:hypothetical protein n=1 Tax=Streptosporangium sp. CA-135522 TaxID=3240072 RepID=UPI003D904E1E
MPGLTTRMATRRIQRTEESRRPPVTAAAELFAERYIGGETPREALERVREINAGGRAASVEYMGESRRDAARVVAETEAFVALAGQVAEQGPNRSTSLGLSHIGSVVDAEPGLANAPSAARSAGSHSTVSRLSQHGQPVLTVRSAGSRSGCHRERPEGTSRRGHLASAMI